MTHTFSRIFPLNSKAPDFLLQDVRTKQNVSLNDVRSAIATVIMFICSHCPYVKHYNQELANISNAYMTKGISFVAISSNDAEAFPDDSPINLKKQADDNQFPFPYLHDESQMIAKAYMAACTPDFYVFDKNLKCIYHGQLDDSRPKNENKVTGKDLRTVLDAVLENRSVPIEQTPSSGCNIKWKDGINPF